MNESATQDSRIGKIEASSGPPDAASRPHQVKLNQPECRGSNIYNKQRDSWIVHQLPLPASTPLTCTSQAHLHEQHPKISFR